MVLITGTAAASKCPGPSFVEVAGALAFADGPGHRRLRTGCQSVLMESRMSIRAALRAGQSAAANPTRAAAST